MKLAIPAIGNDFSAHVSPRTALADHFVYIDSETLDFEAEENVVKMHIPDGAGLQAARKIIRKGADILVTGNIGPRAFAALRAAGVKVVTGAEGRVSDILRQFSDGELRFIDEAVVIEDIT